MVYQARWRATTAGTPAPTSENAVEIPGSNIFLRTHRVERLDVESLPIGQRSRLLVHLVHDALGRPVALPVLVLRGVRPGPVVGLTAALHGNELNGIPVLHRLFDRVDPQQLRGTLVGVVVVNLPGYLSRQRLLEPRFDLNHLFPGNDQGNAAQVYAARFLDRIETLVNAGKCPAEVAREVVGDRLGRGAASRCAFIEAFRFAGPGTPEDEAEPDA